MLEPPATLSPILTRSSEPCGSHRSTREPKRTSPMRSPLATDSSGFFQETTRRAMRPAIDVNIPNREEDTDARARTACVFFFGDYHDAAIRRGNNYARIGRDCPLRITKKRKTEKAKGDQDARKNPPMQNHRYSAKK